MGDERLQHDDRTRRLPDNRAGVAERRRYRRHVGDLEKQPSTDWVVLQDPDGHFCLTKAENW